MAGVGLEKNLQAGAPGWLARGPLALSDACAGLTARIKPLATLPSEKGRGVDNSAFVHRLCSDATARAGRRSAGVMGALSLAMERSGGCNVRKGSALVLALVCLSGCAQAPTPVAHRRYGGHEHF